MGWVRARGCPSQQALRRAAAALTAVHRQSSGGAAKQRVWEQPAPDCLPGPATRLPTFLCFMPVRMTSTMVDLELHGTTLSPCT
jgi:hypothetical protein